MKHPDFSSTHRTAWLIGVNYERSPLAPVDIVEFIKKHIVPTLLSISIVPLLLVIALVAFYVGVKIGFNIAISLL